MSQDMTQTTTIGEHTYTMTMLPPMRSHHLLVAVAKMVGPAMGDAIGSMFGGGNVKDALEREVSGDLLSAAISRLLTSIDNTTLDAVIEAFRESTLVEGKGKLNAATFEVHFCGKLDELYKWIAWGMRVQWGKSLSALVSGAGGLGALVPGGNEGSESQSTSTG